MAAQDKVTFKQDLTEPVKIRHYEGVAFTGDDCGNLIKVALFDGGTPYSGGGTVSATAVLADGTTFPLTQGSITGNMVSVPLEAGALAVSGLMGLYVKISGGGIICTVLNAIFTVQATDTGMVPAAMVTTVNELVQEIKDAQDSIPADLTNLLAAVAPTFSTSVAYSAGAYVWQGGKLYRFTAAHPAGTWTGTDAVDVALGNDVADLKSAFGEVATQTDASSNLFPGEYTTGKSLNADGSTSDNPDRSVTDFIPVDALTSYYTHYGVTQGLVNFIRANCYGADKTSVLSTAINTNTFTTPTGTEFIRICSTISYFDTYYAITTTQEANPYEEYRPSEWIIKTDDTLTDEYLPANAKAVGDAIAEQNKTIFELSDDITYIDTLKNRVYAEKVSRNLMPSILHETNILADGTYEENSPSYAASVKFEVKPYSKIIFTRKVTAQTRALERFKAVFFNGDNVVLSDTTMSTSARSVPENATHVIVGFYESYSTTNYAPMIEYGDGTDISNEYEAYYVPYDEYKPSATQRNSVKKLCVFGDSLAANGNGGNDYWAHIVGTELGFLNIYNRGVGSSRVADTATLYAWVNADGDSYNRGAYAEQPSGVPSEFDTQIDACMSGDDRALTIPLDTDVLLILAGANDASTIGTIGIEAFKTAYRTMLDKIYDHVPNAKLYLCTPPFNANWDMGASAATYQSIRVAVAEIGQEYGLPVIDLKGEMMVNKNNYETYMNTDGVHFNTVNGRKITAEAVIPHLYGFMYVR